RRGRRHAGDAAVDREPHPEARGPDHAPQERLPAPVGRSLLLGSARRVSHDRSGRAPVVLELPVRQGRDAAVAGRGAGHLPGRIRPNGRAIVRKRLPAERCE
ncbi:MAG: hypothetical protein EBU90_30035, partial [Proteobacteria bacterium]|nr:hypothetical protein [Pseudomonadota bacterium]